MKIYLDENTSPYLCRGLQEFQHSLNADRKDPVSIFSIREQFGTGAADEEWIPKVGKENGLAITHDINIPRTKHQRELCEKHGVGLIIIRPPSKKHGLPYWEQVQLLVKYWLDILKVATRKSGHYHYELKPKSGLKEMG